MNQRRISRDALGLTQSDAATRAGVSLATWRRWEDDPNSVSPATQAACERVLAHEPNLRTLRAQPRNITTAWKDCPYLSPRQASAIASELGLWVDLFIDEWLNRQAREPLHEVSPFDQLDLRVMILVNDNRAWAAKAAERCNVVADEIERGILPFDRPGCYFDELLMALALQPAQEQMSDMAELFENVPARTVAESDDWVLDSEWSLVSDAFDDRSRWDEWEVPIMDNHPLLAAILTEHHPYSWFDPGEGTGPGYLQRLAGLAAT